VAPWVPFTGSFLAKRCQLDFVRGIVAWPVAERAARFKKILEIALGFGPLPAAASIRRRDSLRPALPGSRPARPSVTSMRQSSPTVAPRRGTWRLGRDYF